MPIDCNEQMARGITFFEIGRLGRGTPGQQWSRKRSAALFEVISQFLD